MHAILRKLLGGDLRSIGRSNEVAAEVIAKPTLFKIVFSGMLSEDRLIRARSADAVEKASARHPEFLRAHRRQLVGPLADCDQQEVRWHVAQMLPRIRWSPSERRRVLHILTMYLRDESSIVKTCAMEALANLALQTPSLMDRVAPRLRVLTASGTPAMRARGRKLLARLESPIRPSK